MTDDLQTQLTGLWAVIDKINAENQRLEGDNATLKKQLARLNDAITWETACLACSTILDASYAATVRAEQAEARVAELAQQLKDVGQWAGRHVIDLRTDGFTIMHPLSCRPNLFDCIYNFAAANLGNSEHGTGRFYCSLEGGSVVIQEKV
jgi:hypothetical protein